MGRKVKKLLVNYYKCSIESILLFLIIWASIFNLFWHR